MAIDRNLIEEESCLRRFYKIVLGWDYYHLLKELSHNSDSKKQKKYEKKLGLKKVKDTYENVDDYIATFEPLLFEEVKAQIAQSKEADDKVKPKVVLGIEEVIKVEDEEKAKVRRRHINPAGANLKPFLMAIDRNLIEEESCLRRFYKIVLGWDYYHLLKELSHNSDSKKQKKYEKKLGLKKVKDTYENVDDYIATFEPLLFEEVKAQIAQSKEADDKVKPKVVLGIEEVIKVEDEEKVISDNVCACRLLND
ncbi:hypothetical protein CTI12_AA626220 [Artemisia annua]|uniref:Uncharacterized protein n=1 Tax=Artemisia annua TaxID=35608 RepID=A0A2U1KAB1_ARTAN|nr:hypothetical protein CTI12_AA626220 [Artemisia annua]